ncbi:MAG: cytochrome c1 [Rhodobacter sp.]|nr:cytochrome c1 [Rhodobacter sp.]
MLKKLTLSAAMAMVLGTSGGALAAGGDGHTEDFSFSFEGPFGTYDQMQLQRGLQVYTEVCAGCHGLQYVPLRTLGDPGGPGLPEDQVRAYAEQNFEVFDADLDDFRPAKPTDNFPANVDAGAPDLSLMAKGRAGFHGPYGLGINQFFQGMGGAEYVASLLVGYTGEEKEEAGTILYENTAFPGGWISMAPPLYGDDVDYEDGSSTELEAVAKDVSAFLMWTAEPKLMARKEAGFVAVLFLSVLTVLLYLTNKRIWAPVKKRAKGQPAE